MLWNSWTKKKQNKNIGQSTSNVEKGPFKEESHKRKEHEAIKDEIESVELSNKENKK